MHNEPVMYDCYPVGGPYQFMTNNIMKTIKTAADIASLSEQDKDRGKTMPSITLERVHAGNPFADHPQLRTIWDREWASHVEADTIADLDKGEKNPGRNRVLLVRDENSQVIGITGFYLMPRRLVGLRWHGITPDHRGRGYSKLAFQQVRQLASETTNALGVAEYVEMSDQKAPDLIRHFTALGFKASGEPADCAAFPSETALPPGSGAWLEMLFSLYPAHVVGKFVY